MIKLIIILLIIFANLVSISSCIIASRADDSMKNLIHNKNIKVK